LILGNEKPLAQTAWPYLDLRRFGQFARLERPDGLLANVNQYSICIRVAPGGMIMRTEDNL
jgi:hypothetical protein